jgi:hypothetical protein
MCGVREGALMFSILVKIFMLKQKYNKKFWEELVVYWARGSVVD